MVAAAVKFEDAACPTKFWICVAQAAVLSTVTLVAFGKAAESLLGRSVAGWCVLAFGVNGLFMALAHFAVYDVVALTGVAVSMWCAKFKYLEHFDSRETRGNWQASARAA